MTNRTFTVSLVLVVITAVGGAVVFASTGFVKGEFMVQVGKTREFQGGLILLLAGLVGLSFVAWFHAVNGKDSFFRRRLRPASPMPMI